MIQPLRAAMSRRLAIRAVYRVTTTRLAWMEGDDLAGFASAWLAVTAETMPTSSGIKGTVHETPPEEESTWKPKLAAATLPACPTSRNMNGHDRCR